MDPFAYGGGQFSGNGGNGGRYGMQNRFDPPRPAPNADGWSSGDDYLAWNEQNQDVQQGFGGGGGQQPGQQQQQSSNNQFRTPAQSRLQYNQQHYQQRQQQQQQSSNNQFRTPAQSR